MIDISSVETMWLLPIWQQGQEIHAIQQDLKDFYVTITKQRLSSKQKIT